MKTPKPLLALRMVFPLAASLIVLLLGEGIARGSLSADVFASFIFPHIGAYLLAWLLLFLVWLLLDWVFRCPPLSTLGMAVLGCAPCAVNFYTLQLRGEPFLPWDLTQAFLQKERLLRKNLQKPCTNFTPNFQHPAPYGTALPLQNLPQHRSK